MDENSNLIDIVISSVIAMLTFIFIFIACEPGERVTEAFETFNEEFEQCDWYLLQNDVQKLYVMFLLDTKLRINIKCYGNIHCTRETSKKVITVFENLNFLEIYVRFFQITKTGFSYFMTLSKINK